MRADRLVAILLLLQTRGRVTAAEVAAELEISERTARRDLDALGVAGLPVVSTRGRGGGWELVGGGRTDLSGLTSPEAQALFLVAGQAAAAAPEVRAALRKLLRALPEPMRDRAEAASAAVVVDPQGWGEPRPTREAPFLEAVQRAVIDAEQIEIDYAGRSREASTRVVHPLGIAAKGRSWYLLAGTDDGLRTFRVDRIRSVRGTGAPVHRPAGFDLRAAWEATSTRIEELRTPFRAQAVADREIAWRCRSMLGTRVEIGAPRADGRVELEIRGHSQLALAVELAGLAALLEVTGPPELCEQLAAIGGTLVDRYGSAAARTMQPAPAGTPSPPARDARP